MKNQRNDLTGQVYGRLTVLRYLETNRHRKAIWECLCTCGQKKAIDARSFRSGRTTSCGCYQTEFHTKHGDATNPVYRAWSAMKQRCFNEACPLYPSYGGRGITVCERWLVYESFRADMGARPSGHSLDRIDNMGSYEPSNCRWTLPKVQSNNLRNNVPLVLIYGVFKTVTQIAQETGYTYRGVLTAQKRGNDLHRFYERRKRNDS